MVLLNTEPFQSLVNIDSIPLVIPECTAAKKQPTKTFAEIQTLVAHGRHREVKKLLRNHHWPADNMIRTQLWSALCKQHCDNNMTEGFYWDLVVQLFGTRELPDKTSVLPPFVDSKHRHIYHLSAEGKEVADRVVCVLGFACPDITYSPAIYSLASLFLHFMPEEECYNSLTSLVASKKLVFMTQTKSLYEVTWRTVMRATRKYASRASLHLTKFCLITKLEQLYTDWMWWIFQGLPFQHVVRVVDCYLHEGIKVLYRIAMAILKIFYKHSSKRNSPWAVEALNNGLEVTLLKFCRQMPASPHKLLKIAFGIRALSSAYLHRVFVKTEMSMKSKANLPNSNQLIRSRSSENLPTSQSQVNIQLMSHTLSTRELITLWSWLPVRITMYQPVLLYTTEEHGCSLTTFYFRVEQHEPTLLIIKTCSDDVFGAYCSTKWLERNRKDERGNRTAYFGTGETFLFSLFPERSKYPWVGMENDNVCHANELFMAADSKMITIGGGDGQAIWMDENIRFGKSDSCSTFNNPPLCPGRDFEIKVLEVYGFGGISEVIMGRENILQAIPTSKYDTYPGIEENEEEEEMAESLDIHTEFGVRRQRSHTSVQLERLQRNMIKSANVRHVKWELTPVTLTDEEKAELFPKKDISNLKKNHVSVLSKLLKACPYLPLNPFREYSKYDGNAQLGEATRKYGIFITMLNLERRNYPMQVSIIATAKVHDLIGLVCWKCTVEYPDCTLKDSADCYALYIAEDDGNVDFDFPCLDSRETVAKFGFGFLAIVERDSKLGSANHSPTSQEGNSVLCDNVNIKAQQQLEGELNKLLAIEAPLYQLYQVNILNKVRAKSEISLGISGQKIELDPVVKQRTSNKFPWTKLKPATYDMDCVVACDLTETKSNNRAVLRLVYDSTALSSSVGAHSQQGPAVWSNFKHHDFEAEQKVAEDIVQKINNILQLRCSVRRQEYISLRERKSHRRRSFHLGPR